MLRDYTVNVSMKKFKHKVCLGLDLANYSHLASGKTFRLFMLQFLHLLNTAKNDYFIVST